MTPVPEGRAADELRTVIDEALVKIDAIRRLFHSTQRVAGAAECWRRVGDLVHELDGRDGDVSMADDDVLDIVLRAVRRAAAGGPVAMAGTPDELGAHLAALRSGELPAGAKLPTTDEELALLREQVGRMTDDIVAELRYLRWFRRDVGENDADALHGIHADYTEATGKPVPAKWGGK